MTQTQAYRIEVTSPYNEFWRYNVALMCGCFDAADQRIGFASAEDTVADVGTAPAAPPADGPKQRKILLEAPEAHHLLLYVYIIPHTLPKGSDVADRQPFPLQVRIAHGGQEIRTETYAINQWSGASIELRITPEETAAQPSSLHL